MTESEKKDDALTRLEFEILKSMRSYFEETFPIVPDSVKAEFFAGIDRGVTEAAQQVRVYAGAMTDEGLQIIARAKL